MKKKNNQEKDIAIIPRYDSPQEIIDWQEQIKIQSFLKPQQIRMIMSKTPEKWIRERVVAKTKNGKEIKAKYVPQRYFNLALNTIFGWNWNFEILGEIMKNDEVIVKGRLTLKNGNSAKV
jgi:hypothetical protein